MWKVAHLDRLQAFFCFLRSFAVSQTLLLLFDDGFPQKFDLDSSLFPHSFQLLAQRGCCADRGLSFVRFQQILTTEGAGRASPFVSCLARLTVHHASFSSLGTVPTPDVDASDVWALITLLPYATQSCWLSYTLPVWPPVARGKENRKLISWLNDSIRWCMSTGCVWGGGTRSWCRDDDARLTPSKRHSCFPTFFSCF